MTTHKNPWQTRLLIGALSAVGLILLALIVKGQLEQPADHAKKHGSIASDGSSSSTTPGSNSDVSGVKVSAAGAVRTAAAPATVFAHNVDSETFINQRFPNQANPEIVKLPPFTEADKERKAREMFPEYARMQAEVEAEQARLGIKPE